MLAPMPRAGIPTYAVLGNHDYWVGAEEELNVALEQQGIKVLLNEAATIPASERQQEGGQALYVVGLGPHLPGLGRPDRAFAGVPEDAGDAPLAMAGHTHCGRIALPGLPRRSYLELLSDERQVVVDGFAPRGYGAPGNQLFVTCGIGFSLVPIRIAAPPQLVFFELARAP